MKWLGRFWRIFGPVAGLLSMTGCGDMCGNTILSETTAQGSHKRAVVFERDCGATTDFSTQLSILEANEHAPVGGGNVFVADSDHGAVTNLSVSVQWVSPYHLVVSFPARARVFLQEAHLGGVSISYEKIGL